MGAWYFIMCGTLIGSGIIIAGDATTKWFAGWTLLVGIIGFIIGFTTVKRGTK